MKLICLDIFLFHILLMLTSFLSSDIFITSYKYITRKKEVIMKKEMNLTGKIYLVEFLSGMIFYGIGIFLLTPATSPVAVKYIGIGILSLVLLACLIWIIKSRSEKMDERAKNNFNKASNLTIILFSFLLLIFGIIIQFLSVKFYFSSGLIALMLASILIVHAGSFRQLEISGK